MGCASDNDRWMNNQWLTLHSRLKFFAERYVSRDELTVSSIQVVAKGLRSKSIWDVNMSGSVAVVLSPDFE